MDRRQIARLAEGRLDQVPFALLVHAVSLEERTGTLEVERRQLRKRIAVEDGVPVDCWSNLAHETLGRFMVRLGVLDRATADACLAEAFAAGRTFGQVLLDRRLVDPGELMRLRRQNLASKLLDIFSWREGTFRFLSGPPQVLASLRINPGQLVLLGVTRFATQEEVNSGIGPFVGRALAVNPDPPHPTDEMALPEAHASLVEALGTGALRLDQLAAKSALPFDDLGRALYALTVVELVVPADSLPPRDGPTGRDLQLGERRAGDQGLGPEDARALRADLLELVLTHRGKDPFELLGLSEADSANTVRRRFLEFAERYAPWRFDASLIEAAQDVFLAGARAFAALADPARREELVTRRLTQDEASSSHEEQAPARVRPQLLDPDVHFRRGRTLMNSGHYEEAIVELEYALDLDSQSAVTRAELAYCGFLLRPGRASEQALDELSRVLRSDPECGLALYYRGEVLRRLGRWDEAESSLRAAIRPMGQDRRAVEALHALNEARSRED